MPYTISNRAGKPYYLHGVESVMSNGYKRIVYYFASTARSNVIDALPEGYELYHHERTGQPYLRRLPAGTAGILRAR